MIGVALKRGLLRYRPGDTRISVSEVDSIDSESRINMPNVEKDISELKSRISKLEAQIKKLETKASGGDEPAKRPAAPVKFERNASRL